MEYIVVGLGNPGREYERTRHNVGFSVIDILCARYNAKLKKETPNSLGTSVVISGKKVLLLEPTTFMNESGIAVGEVIRRYKTKVENLIVVQDELDLELGIVRLKVCGGLAGHNGLKSIKQHLKNDSFTRVRIGIDKPSHKTQGASHVLKPMSKKELEVISVACEQAADAVELVIAESLEVAMLKIHTG